MALVMIEGVYMNAEVKTTTYEGNSKTTLYLDLYQPDSSQTNKMVQLRTDDLSMMNEFSQDYAMGTKIVVKAGVNAYKNQAYYRLLEVVG